MAPVNALIRGRPPPDDHREADPPRLLHDKLDAIRRLRRLARAAHAKANYLNDGN
jgi:hypothetical protein